MPTVLISPPALCHQPGPYARILTAGGFTLRYPDPPHRLLTPEQVVANLAGVDAVLAAVEAYPGSIISRFPQLKIIARVGVGYDAVDVAAASEHNVLVGYTPGTNQESVAEQTFTLLLGMSRDVVRRHQSVVDGTFNRTPVRALRELTIGLVGMGRIGRAVASRALAFRLRVIAHDPFLDPQQTPIAGVEWRSFDQLIQEADIVSLHVPMSDQNRAMINADTLAKMKRGSLLINTSRGGLVDVPALIAALESGQLGGAALDVFEHEPLPPTSPLLQAPNLLLSPHIAGVDQKSLDDMASMAAQTVVDLYQQRWPADRLVNADQVRQPWTW